ncbi:MAG TPA: NADH-quinone oxidoreductase subunit M, partial [Candidatus Xenobia bacterium]|nr:NADH-quinone oxidoreductase subunit M [Candidatus Xenobia bacterium]
MTGLLSTIVFLPLAGGLAVLVAGDREGRRDALVRRLALGVSLAVLALAGAAWARFDRSPGAPEFQLVERRAWIPDFGIGYHIGVDGIGLVLVLLTAFLTPLALLSSWGSIDRRVREFSFFLLALESAMLGVFVSLDLFLFYLFWDAMLVPMYFLIGIWGYDRRVYAAVKFILYTLAGSVLMLVAIIALAWLHYSATGAWSFDLADLYALDVPARAAFWLFLAFTLAFAIKVPLVPFHTWLPDAHVEAPTAGSVILAGVLLKMGTYGLVRFSFPLFPEAAQAFAPYLAGLAVAGIVYGALVAMVQPDLKKLVAYSSVSHLGFVVLGICALDVEGLQGAVFQMLSHGVSTGGLFLVVGMLADRRHTRLIAEFGGLRRVVPGLVAAFLVIVLSSMALPGLNGFVGEFLVLVGAYRWRPALATIAATGVILSAAYLLWMFQRVCHGPLGERNAHLADLDWRERAVLAPIVAAAVLMGAVPGPLLRATEPAAARVVERSVARIVAAAPAQDAG